MIVLSISLRGVLTDASEGSFPLGTDSSLIIEGLTDSVVMVEGLTDSSVILEVLPSWCSGFSLIFSRS